MKLWCPVSETWDGEVHENAARGDCFAEPEGARRSCFLCAGGGQAQARHHHQGSSEVRLKGSVSRNRLGSY